MLRCAVPIALLLAACASRARPPTSVVGTWRGSSVCLVHPSPCHDETVVYHATAAGDGYQLVGNKVVDGAEVWMGTLTCTLDGARLRCPIDRGVFTFTLDGDRWHGELALSDGTRFRVIEVERAH